jgi:hypothetical protein
MVAGANGQSSSTINKKKFKLHKKKRAVVRNMKKVHSLDTGAVRVLRKPRASKKKQQKDAKRRRIFVEAEKAKLLKSGLITQDDIDKMEAAKDQDGSDAEGDMEMEP